MQPCQPIERAHHLRGATPTTESARGSSEKCSARAQGDVWPLDLRRIADEYYAALDLVIKGARPQVVNIGGGLKWEPSACACLSRTELPSYPGAGLAWQWSAPGLNGQEQTA